MDKRTISILGSTGSIGVQALDVLGPLPTDFEIGFLTANRNMELLEKQASMYKPHGVAIGDTDAYSEFKKFSSFKGKIIGGQEGLVEAASYEKNDIVLSALVGFSGVIPTLAAIESGADIALANKETLVSAGEIITRAAREHNVNIIAVDSEHSAIMQCLAGEDKDSIEKLILTASGGPFLNTPLDKFKDITLDDALSHPNWDMGDKITIDSATMMNKGFEIIEARWLFDIESSRIDVLIHPESIVHSMVCFTDGSVKAQLGLPDMKLPISYALNYPGRKQYDLPRLDLAEIGGLSFRKTDFERYPCLRLAFDAIKTGGTSTAILNAANEIAVSGFLNGKIKFTKISEVIEKTLSKIKTSTNPSLDRIIEIDAESRRIAQTMIDK